MSEYQYYEFAALDRPLTESQQSQVRKVSSRAEISPTRFVNVYNYGDFRGDVLQFMTDYYDAMVYVANWGTHRLMLRLPQDLADPKALAAYCPGESMALESTRTGVVLDFDSQLEDFADWEEGQGWMERLSPLRADLLRGDLRAAYLGWLMCAQIGELDDEVPEPPVPAGLGTLSRPLCDLAEYLRVDAGLVAAAAEYSPGSAAPATGIEDWIATLPEEEKNRLLIALAQGDDPLVGARLLQRFHAEAGKNPARTPGRRRTVRQLLTRAEQIEEEFAARRRAEAAAARNKALDAIAGREEQLWQRVQELLSATHRRGYDEAAAALNNLHDLAQRDARLEDFRARLAGLYDRHRAKKAFWNRLPRLKALL